ncbi:MAG TPA: fumarylacetoacetate hydrolase family protein [Amycolatopsis sp.]|uniref:fumarylacetoacetate hydrolase family protein n=1 Tax=Amycolatopsis sp. TaxID=37632 RepID=UPI002B466AA1|nr:fumarylacetoacetate hydrolase family protein [Amycolatopsis sp.]HKS47028.1 fumarylacetoacetate hydrolase family protein [Amycolatopsis sp.]
MELPYLDVGALLAHADWRALAQVDGHRHPYKPDRVAPVVPAPPKIWCVGMNYADHAAEAAKPTLPYPTLFGKFAIALTGPRDPVCLPFASEQADWEVELAVVVGWGGRHVATENALDHIAGFTIMNDVSMRDWQRRTPQYLQGKTFAAATPLGPELVTPDEAPDPYTGVALTCRVNGEVMQSASTKEMIFGVRELVAYVSTIAPLEPGDVIATGTPAGIGALRTPPRFLCPGDVVECVIDGVGELSNQCVPERR